MFRRKEPTPEPPYSQPGNDSTWEPLSYRNPQASILNGAVVGARCPLCRTIVHPDWSIQEGGMVLVRYGTCPKCGRKP